MNCEIEFPISDFRLRFNFRLSSTKYQVPISDSTYTTFLVKDGYESEACDCTHTMENGQETNDITIHRDTRVAYSFRRPLTAWHTIRVDDTIGA